MRLWLTLACLLMPALACGEPYFAVRESYDCSLCHINPSGGGMRTAFGNVYAQTQLPATLQDDAPAWTGALSGPIAMGGNARYSLSQFDDDNGGGDPGFATERVNLYLAVTPSESITLYIDQQLAPGGAFSRESWIKITLSEQVYLKAGKFVLPYGWRLEDDLAFIRRVSGINFTSADNGLEIGHSAGNFTSQFSVTNGASGAAENDDGKPLSLRSYYAMPMGQLGISVNINRNDLGDKTLFGIFAGFNTGPVTWLAEWDRLDDEGDPLVGQQDIALLEANVLLARGHNLKLTTESVIPEANRQPRQFRYSAQWELFPYPYLHIRLVLRYYDSDGDLAAQNGQQYFIQLHGFF